MARTELTGMAACRYVRRRMNARLVKAQKEGRLDEELAEMERRTRRWMAETARKPRRRKPA